MESTKIWVRRIVYQLLEEKWKMQGNNAVNEGRMALAYGWLSGLRFRCSFDAMQCGPIFSSFLAARRAKGAQAATQHKEPRSSSSSRRRKGRGGGRVALGAGLKADWSIDVKKRRRGRGNDRSRQTRHKTWKEMEWNWRSIMHRHQICSASSKRKKISAQSAECCQLEVLINFIKLGIFVEF